MPKELAILERPDGILKRNGLLNGSNELLWEGKVTGGVRFRYLYILLYKGLSHCALDFR